MRTGEMVFVLLGLAAMLFWIDCRKPAISPDTEQPSLMLLPAGLPFPTGLFMGAWN